MHIQMTMEQEKIKTCAFTGHRELEQCFDPSVVKKEIENLIERGVDTFFNGMALGFDMLTAEIVLLLKKKYKHIRLIVCIPYLGQEKYYGAEDKKRYVKILSKADEKVCLSDGYYKGCMLARDRYMADRADVLFAYCRKNTGGTAYTLSYFKNKYPLKEIVLV